MLCRYKQNLEIYPPQGKKITLQLNRTRFLLRFGPFSKVVFEGTEIQIPTLGCSCEVELHWREDHFHFQVHGDHPVSLNNTLVFSGVLQACDVFLIGYAKIKIAPKELTNLSKMEMPFEEESLIMNQSNLPILLQGETGVGKTTLAKKFHENSQRRHFVHINLSALSPSLIESELFGHRKGAFTGAFSDKEGAFDRADGGTLFLDEIDSLPKEIQVKLLTFLDHQEFLPVGGTVPKQVKAKLICASGRELIQVVNDGHFRQDLYYRLASGFKLNLPPLRKSKQLIQKIISDFEKTHGCAIESKLRKFYLDFHWPGNHRQLSMHLQKKLVLAKGGVIRLNDQDRELVLLKNHVEKIQVPTLEQHKAGYIKYCYYLFNKDAQATAQHLNINRKTVDKFIKNFSLKGLSGCEWPGRHHQSLTLL